jgi:hypothetical protein
MLARMSLMVGAASVRRIVATIAHLDAGRARPYRVNCPIYFASVSPTLDARVWELDVPCLHTKLSQQFAALKECRNHWTAFAPVVRVILMIRPLKSTPAGTREAERRSHRWPRLSTFPSQIGRLRKAYQLARPWR